MLDFNYAKTGLTPFDIEEEGVGAAEVRREVLAAVGGRTIVAHTLPTHLMRLGIDPQDLRQNEIIDIAMDNRVNFEMMVKGWLLYNCNYIDVFLFKMFLCFYTIF